MNIIGYKYLHKNQKIDFITIDVDGFDLNVLKSNDWNKYKPKIIVIEALKTSNIEDLYKTELFVFLKTKGYEVILKLFNSVFFILHFAPLLIVFNNYN